jgi:hypothetical protein
MLKITALSSVKQLLIQVAKILPGQVSSENMIISHDGKIIKYVLLVFLWRILSAFVSLVLLFYEL